MDPAATIAAVLAGRITQAEARDALSHWYSRHGYRPTLASVEVLAAQEAPPLPRNWRSVARSLGAVA